MVDAVIAPDDKRLNSNCAPWWTPHRFHPLLIKCMMSLMQGDTNIQGKEQKTPDLPEERADGGLNFYNTDQMKNFGMALVEKASVQKKYDLSDEDVKKLSQPISRKSAQTAHATALSHEDDPAKLRALMPEGTHMETYFDSLLKLLPNSGASTDSFEFLEAYHPHLEANSEKKLKTQLKNTIDAINRRLRERNVAPFFKHKKGVITRLR